MYRTTFFSIDHAPRYKGQSGIPAPRGGREGAAARAGWGPSPSSTPRRRPLLRAAPQAGELSGCSPGGWGPDPQVLGGLGGAAADGAFDGSFGSRGGGPGPVEVAALRRRSWLKCWLVSWPFGRRVTGERCDVEGVGCYLGGRPRSVSEAGSFTGVKTCRARLGRWWRRPRAAFPS